MGKSYVIGTCDTKGAELKFIRDILRSEGAAALLVDVSTSGTGDECDISAAEVASFHPDGAGAVLGLHDRGKAISAMSEALARFVVTRGDVEGVIAAGGSGGTALVAPALRQLPIGMPKVLVSTVASGNVAPYVGASDISLVYSVTDIAGLNPISRKVLANAAHALAGMLRHRGAEGVIAGGEKPAVGLTMFGVTTPCTQRVTQELGDEYDCIVFHATGTGGQSFEKLIDSGLLTCAIDVTTTEVCDLLLGGVFAATEDRFGAFIRTRVPYVGSCGALDMVNFGAMETVPERYRQRRLHVHNPQVTLMRTTPEECERIGAWIANRLNACEGEVRFLIPEGGVSALDAPGQPFHDPEADAALFAALERDLRQTPSRRLLRIPHHINDEGFARALVEAFREITTIHPRQQGRGT